jgi:hypothetical protein
MTKILTLGDWGPAGLVLSSIHEAWARQYSSTLETRLKYITSDCFETFPFPQCSAVLSTVGERYYTHRGQNMAARFEGLTSTYNRFHSPNEVSTDIATLRTLHVEMDNAVAAAYGWTDLDLGHDYHETKQGIRYTISEAARREALDRLLALNHQRYAQEQAGTGAPHPKRAGKRKQPGEEPLFAAKPASD